MRPWTDLTPEEQTRLRQDYQEVLDRNPRTCSLQEKIDRFTQWLADQGVAFSVDDIPRTQIKRRSV